ncbi:uncharacterized protein COLE_03714 [Cutaneotrichosporon oleaginosum]|uniref:uncharacterized protein n=1 Tax=Cutaneotrichosporon oleaginosum TaxID=879819 RepID=UPI001324F30B|nr:hypothetical protein COLE_03714 [Cutaneotrichosporon oleaginosum]
MKLDIDHIQHLAARADVTPNTFQTYTIVAACLFIPITAAIWHTPHVRDAFVGPKVFVIFTHEMFHVLAGVLCGGRLHAFVIDPNLGGYTGVSGLKRTVPRTPDPYSLPTPEQLFWSPSVVVTLLAGPLGSAIIGFLYIVRLQDIVASKIASFTIALGLLVAGAYAMHWITYMSVFCSEAILIGLWFGAHGSALRFLVLFFGAMHLFYTLWDYLEDAVFGKTHPSDCQELQRNLGLSAEAWLAFIFLFEALVFMAATLAGICVFKKTPEEMYANAAGFLPT